MSSEPDSLGSLTLKRSCVAVSREQRATRLSGVSYSRGSVLGLTTGLGQRFVLQLEARPRGVRVSLANDRCVAHAKKLRTTVVHAFDFHEQAAR